MKKIITLVTILLFATTLWAQAPQKMSYQAVIRNASNALVTNANIRMRISVLQGTATGTAVYVESQTATTNTNGLVTVEIGAGTVVSGTFASIGWGTNTYFIKTETDPSGGTNYSITGTSQLLSVPYALFASSGNTGPAGPTGAPGPAGPQGATGSQGPIGLTGATGPQGAPGTNGTNGAVGATGPQGPIGLTGPQGTPGTNGTNGAAGATGPQGIQGIPGAANISGTTNKIVKFTNATTGGDSQISDDGTYVKIKPNGYTGFDEDLSMVQFEGSNNTLRLIGTGTEYGELGKLSFGDVDRVYITEDIDDNLKISSWGRLAIMGGNVGLGTLTPAEKLDVIGKTKTINLQVTNGAAVGKVLTSDATGNATWQTPTAPTANQSFQTDASGLSTSTQGSVVDFPATNVIAPTTGTYLVTYFLDSRNTFTCINCAPATPKVYQTFASLQNKTMGYLYQKQAIDFRFLDTDHFGAVSNESWLLPNHQISGSIVLNLNANEAIGFKMESSADSGAGGQIVIISSNVTLVRLF